MVDSKMKPPSYPVRRQTLKSRVGGNIPKTVDGKGFFASENSSQEVAIVKRNSKENVGSIVAPRQKSPSKELQMLKEKEIEFLLGLALCTAFFGSKAISVASSKSRIYKRDSFATEASCT